MTEPVLFYAGEFGYVFSNFSAFEVEWKGQLWPTSEHAYQAAKFDAHDLICRINAASSPYMALQLAREFEDDGMLRPSWSSEKVDVMREIIAAKHDQHPYVQKQLKQSIGREIIENAPKDAFWGRGPDWKGQNMLGKLWMELRYLRYGEGPFEAEWFFK